MDKSYSKTNPTGKYFASLPTEELVPILKRKSQDWFDTITGNNYLDKVKRSWNYYHGNFTNGLSGGHSIDFGGEQGEIVQIPINHYRNFAQHILVMVTANRPSFQARATNTDYKSLVQTTLANSLLDYYMREKRLERFLKTAVEYAVTMGTGYIKMEWNSTTGKKYDYNEETDTPIYEGDVVFKNMSPFDVAFDSTRESAENNDWVITRTWKNKYDLAAKYPELEDEIIKLKTKSDEQFFRLVGRSYDETDDVAVYEFYHERTESMPDGRYVMFLEDDIAPLDTPMPYRSLPVYRISPADILGTPYGYTSMWDILPIQDGINSLNSVIMTNQNAFGVQNILNPRGSDISISSLGGALNVIDYNPMHGVEGGGKPESLQLTNTPKEIFEYLQMLERFGETLSGVNPVARGNSEAVNQLKSGNALALVQSQALQFMSGLQQSYIQLIEDVGTGLVNILKDFASVPRVAAIAGVSNRGQMKEFTGDDLNQVNRVIVDVGNALAQCLKLDTPVLMFDGTVKMVQDIKSGEEVMGPDSKKRTVLNVNSGEEEMYDIHHKTVKDEFIYGCNKGHILSLKYCSNDGRYGLTKGQKIDISVAEFLELPERRQRLFMGYRSGIDFDSQEILIPPYILGAWLGDGTSSTTRLTTMDKELEDEWRNYADSLNLEVKVYDQKNNKSKIFAITSGKQNGRSDRNEFMNHLRSYDLVNNKHIPAKYLRNSRENRLELLAGLIDTDGSLVDETIVFTQKSNTLSSEVVYLAKSLGFKVNQRKIKNSGMIMGQSVPIREYNKITIGGNTWEIPLRLPRKIVSEVKKQKDWQNYGIRIKPQGIGTYYGFTLKEEPHFLLGDFTVTHNTTAGKIQMADNLLQMFGDKLNPAQYFQVLNTGRLDALTDGESKQVMLVRAENEMLVDGKGKVQALATDSHKMHIEEHRDVLSDPTLRQDEDLVERVTAHILEHEKLLRETDADLLVLIGEQPLGPVGGSPNNPQNDPGAGGPKPGGEMPIQGLQQTANEQAASMQPPPAEPAKSPDGGPTQASDVPIGGV